MWIIELHLDVLEEKILLVGKDLQNLREYKFEVHKSCGVLKCGEFLGICCLPCAAQPMAADPAAVWKHVEFR